MASSKITASPEDKPSSNGQERKLITKANGEKIPKLRFINEAMGKAGIRHPRLGDITAVHLENPATCKVIWNYDVENKGSLIGKVFEVVQ